MSSVADTVTTALQDTFRELEPAVRNNNKLFSRIMKFVQKGVDNAVKNDGSFTGYAVVIHTLTMMNKDGCLPANAHRIEEFLISYKLLLGENPEAIVEDTVAKALQLEHITPNIVENYLLKQNPSGGEVDMMALYAGLEERSYQCKLIHDEEVAPNSETVFPYVSKFLTKISTRMGQADLFQCVKDNWETTKRTTLPVGGGD